VLLTRVLQYVMLKFTPFIFILPSPIPGTVSTVYFSICIHECAAFALYSPPRPFSTSSPLLLVPVSPGRTALLLSSFVKEKIKMTF
jgi:hypothetical protein